MMVSTRNGKSMTTGKRRQKDRGAKIPIHQQFPTILYSNLHTGQHTRTDATS